MKVSKKPTIGEHLSSHQVSKLIHVSPSSVLQWVDQGKLPAFRTPGGHRRVPRQGLIRFLREYNMPIPKELGGTHSLLIIDDDTDFHKTLKRLLKRKSPDMNLEFATDATEGLLALGTRRPDAVLVDAFMAGIDGPALVKRLRENPVTANLLIIGMSGRPSRKVSSQFIEAGADGWLEKPFGAEELLEQLGSHDYASL